MDTGAPKGLSLSLDAMIAMNREKGRRRGGGGGRNRGGGGGMGRGGRHGGLRGHYEDDGWGDGGWEGGGRGGGRPLRGGRGGRGGGGHYHNGGFNDALRPNQGGVGKLQRHDGGARTVLALQPAPSGRGYDRFGASAQAAGPGRRRRNDPLAYRQDQQCYVDEETGEVVVQFHETDIVRVNISGDVKLTSGGFHTVTTLASLNDALKPINMEVAGAQEGPVSQVEWSVRDGRSLYRFTDDMVLYAKGPQSSTRGAMILQAYLHPEAAAATAASNAQAVQEGLLSAAVGGVPQNNGMRRGGPAQQGGRRGGGRLGSRAVAMMEDGDDDGAALGFVSPRSDAGFGRNAAERELPVFSRLDAGHGFVRGGMDTAMAYAD